MKEIHVEIEGNKAKLFTPYDKKFVRKIKSVSNAQWNAGERCWVIDQSSLEVARNVMRDVCQLTHD